MKHIIIGALFLMVVGAGIYGTIQNEPVEVMNEKPLVEEVTVPEWQLDEDAIKAAQAVIDRKNNEAQLKSVEEQLEALEAKYKEEKEVLMEQKEAYQRELGVL